MALSIKEVRDQLLSRVNSLTKITPTTDNNIRKLIDNYIINGNPDALNLLNSIDVKSPYSENGTISLGNLLSSKNAQDPSQLSLDEVRQIYKYNQDPSKYLAGIIDNSDLSKLSDSDLKSKLSSLLLLPYDKLQDLKTATVRGNVSYGGKNYGIDFLSDFGPTQSNTNDPTTSTIPQYIKQIQDILAERKYVNDTNDQISKLQNEIPVLLDKNREEYYGQQRADLQDYITGQYAPQVVQSLGVRGLANSGEVGATIANRFSDLSASIDQAQSAQQNEEINFWADQAYQTTLNQLIKSKSDVSNEVSNIRQDVLTKSQQNFQKQQQTIQDKFDVDLFKQKNEDALQTYQRNLERQQSQANANLAQGIGTSVAQLGLMAALA